MTDDLGRPPRTGSPDAEEFPDAADAPTSTGEEELVRPTGDELEGHGGGPEERETPETEIEVPYPDPGFSAVDDHVAGQALGLGHQPVRGLDHGVDDEHLSSSGQGVRPEPR